MTGWPLGECNTECLQPKGTDERTRQGCKVLNSAADEAAGLKWHCMVVEVAGTQLGERGIRLDGHKVSARLH
jgi:hypothetical protein